MILLQRRYVLRGIGVVLFIAVGVALWRQIQLSREGVHRSICVDNVAKIRYALQEYHFEYGEFPPGRVVGPNGHQHSWRVLLLPYWDFREEFDNYDFGRAWNDPQNIQATQAAASLFVCLADKNGTPGRTSYLGIVGNCTSAHDAKNDEGLGTEKVMGVVESPDSTVHWLEPHDLALHEVSELLSNETVIAARNSQWLGPRPGQHPPGIQASTVDGPVVAIESPAAGADFIRDVIDACKKERPKIIRPRDAAIR